MKRALGVLVLAAIAFVAYRQIFAAAPARTFGRFAEAWARGRTEEAMKLAEGDAVRRDLDRKPFVNVIKPPWQVDAFHGFRTSEVSSTRTDSGDVELEARQAIAFDPPGATTGIGGACVATFRHRATLRKTSDGWKVVAFHPECVDVVMTRRR